MEPASRATTALEIPVLLVDLDGDGDRDAAVGDQNGLRILLNDHDDLSVATVLPYDVSWLDAADLGNDGGTDLVVGQRSSKPTVILVNDGKGSFTEDDLLVASANKLKVTDLDGDQRPDLVVIGAQTSVLLDDGGERFGKRVDLEGGSSVSDFAIGDIDRDGDVDLVAVRLFTLLTWENEGDGSFSAPTTYDLFSTRARQVELLELDDDDTPEVVIGGAQNRIWVIYELGGPARAGETLGAAVTNFHSGDVIGDERKDLLTTVQGRPTLAILEASSAGFEPPVFLGVPNGRSSTSGIPDVIGVGLGDMDDDGDQDVAVVMDSDKGISVLRRDAQEGLRAAIDLIAAPGASVAATGDLNEDGRDDLITISVRQRRIGLRQLQGRRWIEVNFDVAESPPTAALLGNLTGDDVDLAIAFSSGEISIYENYSRFLFNPTQSLRASTPLGGLASCRINDDEHADLVTLRSDTGLIEVFLNSPDTGFDGPIEVHPGAGPASGLIVSDFDLDGFCDLLVHRHLGSLDLHYGSDTLEFESRFIIPPSSSPALIDANADGKPDLVVADGVGQAVIYLNGGDRVFREQGRYEIGGAARGFAVGDFNRDGFDDFAAAVPRGIALAANAGGLGFAPAIIRDDLDTFDYDSLVAGNFDNRPGIELAAFGDAGAFRIFRNESQEPTAADCDGDCVPDSCQQDSDADGVPDSCDRCNGADDRVDSDGDSLPDCDDNCPFDVNTAQVDRDRDGVGDACDECPNDPEFVDEGICGCGRPDVDSDGDGLLDCLEECPSDPGKTEPGVCDCGISDSDRDRDGTLDCNDLCPADPAKLLPGNCGCGSPKANNECPIPILGAGDIDTSKDTRRSSSPFNFVSLESITFFSATDGIHGRELWRTDGTSEGTHMVGDLALGDRDSNPHGFQRFQDSILFVAENARAECTLWKLDLDGVTELRSFPSRCENRSGIESRDLPLVGDIAALDEVALFIATDELGTELWRTNGTVDGTEMLADIHAGERSSTPLGLTRFANQVYFYANDGEHGREVWSSDGSATGTTLLRDIYPGSADTLPLRVASFAVRGNWLLFQANDGTRGDELWRTDGTGDGTSIVTDVSGSLFSGLEGGTNFDFAPVTTANLVFFPILDPNLTASYVWRSDGTQDGTIPVFENTTRSEQGFFPALPVSLLSYREELYFVLNTENGAELWAADGSVDGTRRIAARPGLRFSELTAAEEGLRFFAEIRSDLQLWSSDLTDSGTQRVASIGRSRTLEGPSMIDVNGQVLLAAAIEEADLELAISDGTEEGTVQIAEINDESQRTGSSIVGDFPVAIAGDTVLFSADGTSQPYWATAGPPSTTIALPITDLSHSISVGDCAFFRSRTEATGSELWQSDGSTDGTSLVIDLQPGSGSSSPSRLTPFSNEGFLFDSSLGVYFSDGTANGTEAVEKRLPDISEEGLFNAVRVDDRVFFEGRSGELWTANPELSAATKVVDIPLRRSGGLSSFARFGNRALFVAAEPAGQFLWSSDGTAEGTIRISQEAGPLEQLNPAVGVSLDHIFVFSASSAEAGVEPWATDGSPGGTVQLGELAPGAQSSQPSDFKRIGDIVYFVAAGELWRSDGSVGGTWKVKDANGSPDGSIQRGRLYAGATRLYFVADDGVGPASLWTSDGTPQGTRPIRTDNVPAAWLTPPTSGVSPPEVLVIGDHALFTAFDERIGLELWFTDGSVPGTRPVFDLDPGPFSSNPSDLVRVGRRVLFAAETGAEGREVWSIQIDDLAPPCDVDCDGDGKRNAADLVRNATSPMSGTCGNRPIDDLITALFFPCGESL